MRTARWEPLVEPGLSGTACTSAKAGKPSRCCLAFDDSATVEATLTRDAALALRGLLDEVKGAHTSHLTMKDDQVQTRLKNATGVDVLLDVFDHEGSFLEKVRVSRNSEGTLSPNQPMPLLV